MSLIEFDGIGIRGISSVVPANVVNTKDQTEYFDEQHLDSFIQTTGVKSRRLASKNMTAADLCYNAAERLISRLQMDKKDIDIVIFLSQTPDHRIPGTSIILQDRLGLSTSTIAFDINMTCSGFIYGLFVAFSLIAGGGGKNVLFLIGETLSKIISPFDKSTGLLLGDGGSAILISRKDDIDKAYFSLNTDGSYYKSVIIPSGGYREMSSPESLRPLEYEDGSIRNKEQLEMDGLGVFSFAVSTLPKDVKELVEYSGYKIENIDKYIFHQANKFMINHIAKKLKIAKSDKLLYSIDKYGNTSGVSIPLTISEERMKINNGDTCLLNAIGAGFSWGSCILKLTNCEILPVMEV